MFALRGPVFTPSNQSGVVFFLPFRGVTGLFSASSATSSTRGPAQGLEACP
jgi:hypothetical protein